MVATLPVWLVAVCSAVAYRIEGLLGEAVFQQAFGQTSCEPPWVWLRHQGPWNSLGIRTREVEVFLFAKGAHPMFPAALPVQLGGVFNTDVPTCQEGALSPRGSESAEVDCAIMPVASLELSNKFRKVPESTHGRVFADPRNPMTI